MELARKGAWMQTAGGRAYWPVDPRPDEVFIGDIAHSLSQLCRYGGHCTRFYSVAEHSVHVSRLVPPEHALAGLLHDAAEAYCCDVPRPLKGSLANYREIEDANWQAICSRFGLPGELPEIVKDADIAMLFAEQKVLMLPSPRPDWGMGLETSIVADPGVIRCWLPLYAARVFLERFVELSGEKSS